jgi:hypothetical protein
MLGLFLGRETKEVKPVPTGNPPTGTTTGTGPVRKEGAVAAPSQVSDIAAERSEPCWIRTNDPLLKRQMLYRLS